MIAAAAQRRNRRIDRPENYGGAEMSDVIRVFVKGESRITVYRDDMDILQDVLSDGWCEVFEPEQTERCPDIRDHAFERLDKENRELRARVTELESREKMNLTICREIQQAALHIAKVTAGESAMGIIEAIIADPTAIERITLNPKPSDHEAPNAEGAAV